MFIRCIKQKTPSTNLLVYAAIIISGLLSFAFYAPTAVFWRDSGEFIISAYYLDVAHPAGFPFYSQLTNLSTLLPFGTITWRVNFASTIFATCFLYISFITTKEVCKKIYKKNFDCKVLLLISLLYFLLCFSAPVFIKQAFSAEVYLLNACLIQLVYWLYLKYTASTDWRFLLTAAFISGLAIGNHVTFVLALVPLPILLAKDLKQNFSLILPLFFSGILGLMIYAYIPTRANNNLPLNTAQANSTENFLKLISNQRSKIAIDQTVPHASSNVIEQLRSTWTDLSKDIKVLKSELGIVYLILASAGALILLIKLPAQAFFLYWIFLSHWYFFKRWPPDPWMPLFWIVGLLASVTLIFIAQLFSKKTAVYILLLAAIVFAPIQFTHIKSQLIEARDYAAPLDIAYQSLEPLERNSFYISESSWFLLKYLQQIEGYRSDINLVYLRQITHPEYFGALQLNNKQIKNLTDLTNQASKYTSIYFEPNRELAEFYKTVVFLDQHGQNVVSRKKVAGVDQQYLPKLKVTIAELINKTANNWQPVDFEAKHYLQTYVDNHAKLLRTLKQDQAALELYQLLCSDEKLCNATLLNNMALCYLELGDRQQAILTWQRALNTAGRQRRLLIERNLAAVVGEVVN